MKASAYQLLANAIIVQAVIDYRKALKRHDKNAIRELENFFRSVWFYTLTDVPYEVILDAARGKPGTVISHRTRMGGYKLLDKEDFLWHLK